MQQENASCAAGFNYWNQLLVSFNEIFIERKLILYLFSKHLFS